MILDDSSNPAAANDKYLTNSPGSWDPTDLRFTYE